MSGDAATTLGLLLPLAQKGNVFAQYSVGSILEDSLHRGPDPMLSCEEQDQWFVKHGEELSHWREQDQTEAAEWYKKVAMQEHPEAVLRLAALYRTHNWGALPWSHKTGMAKEWYERAAQNGYFGVGGLLPAETLQDDI